MADSAAGEGTSRWTTHRALREPVLESVEEEIGVEPAAAPMAQTVSGGDAADTSGQMGWARWTGQVTQRVRQQPARAALLAVGAGALTAWLLGQALRRRKERG